MLIIAITILAIVLLVLVSRPRWRRGGDVIGMDGTVDGTMDGGDWLGRQETSVPDSQQGYFTPGGGDFGGGGSSGSWGESGDSGGDGGGGDGGGGGD